MRELRRRTNEILITMLSCVLPLYFGNGWWKLGDVKYALFRNISVICLVIWTVALLIEFVMDRVSGKVPLQAGEKRIPHPVSSVTVFMGLYGASVLISTLFSNYKDVAMKGFDEWYMGAISQLLFVAIYVMTAYTDSREKYPLYCWYAAFGAVILLGYLHKFGMDPLGMMRGFNDGDWEYSHMLSTIGNMNWFCGYCSVAAAPVAARYMTEDKRILRGVLYGISVASLALLMVHGSDTGILVAAVIFVVCFLWEARNGTLRKTCALLFGTCFGIGCFAVAVNLIGRKALRALPADGVPMTVLASPVWWFLGVAFLLMCLVPESRMRKFINGKNSILCVVIAGICLAVWKIPTLMQEGIARLHGRYDLWELAIKGFEKNSILRKLVGVGPDCFANYIYETFEPGALLELEGRWSGVVFANAHNEWLNHLVNIGIIGIVAYFGLFVAAIIRYRRNLTGVLAITAYFGVSLVGFQQCLSTPILFLILGMCERQLLFRERFETDCDQYNLEEQTE